MTCAACLLTCFAVHVAIIDNKGHATNLTSPVYLVYMVFIAAALAQIPRRWRWLVLLPALAEWGYTRLLYFEVAGRQFPVRLVHDPYRAWVLGGGLFFLCVAFAALILAAAMWRPAANSATTPGQTRPAP